MSTEKFLNLSPRENETLQCLIQGMTNREIAKIMDITMPTVKLYMGNIMTKTGTRNRTHLAITYLKFMINNK